MNHISIKLHWSNGKSQIALAQIPDYRETNWFQHRDKIHKSSHTGTKPIWCCLWGPADKTLNECTVVECLTPKGKPQVFGPAARLFNRMVKAAQYVELNTIR